MVVLLQVGSTLDVLYTLDHIVHSTLSFHFLSIPLRPGVVHLPQRFGVKFLL